MIHTGTIETEKAECLMKALCNHFALKITARYEGDKGYIEFGDGKCEITATSNTLTLQVDAANAEDLPRLERVVVDHLLRSRREYRQKQLDATIIKLFSFQEIEMTPQAIQVSTTPCWMSHCRDS